MADTLLHRACENFKATVTVIRRLIEEHPEALTTQNRNGTTPLHLALDYHRDSPKILRLLLDRCPSRVIGMLDCIGSTPLHDACFTHVWDVEIIQRMVRMHPKALRMLDSMGWSPLHSACSPLHHPSLEAIQYLVNECQALCHLLDHSNRSPYDQAADIRHRRTPAEILNFLRESMKEAAIAFMVCSSQGMITLTPAVTAHIQRVLHPDFATQGFSMSYMSSNENIQNIQNIRLLLDAQKR
jgi:hypothetical protein